MAAFPVRDQPVRKFSVMDTSGNCTNVICYRAAAIDLLGLFSSNQSDVNENYTLLIV